MRKIYRKLTKEQKARGVIFSSTLSRYTEEQESDNTHEVYSFDENKEQIINRLKDDKFFRNSSFNYNIIRT